MGSSKSVYVGSMLEIEKIARQKTVAKQQCSKCRKGSFYKFCPHCGGEIIKVDVIEDQEVYLGDIFNQDDYLTLYDYNKGKNFFLIGFDRSTEFCKYLNDDEDGDIHDIPKIATEADWGNICKSLRAQNIAFTLKFGVYTYWS
jgi:hypothetical protein